MNLGAPVRGLALSPVDGRYGDRLAPLAEYFSERALTRARVRVEVAHALALDSTGIFGTLSEAERALLREAHEGFDQDAYAAVKAIEAEVRHDVKACELYLKSKTGLARKNRIHFGLTSEDVNNLAYGTCFKAFLEEAQLPGLRRLMAALLSFVKENRAVPFPARTHGQPASPTTAGKEMAVFLGRLLRAYQALAGTRFFGKLNGATGNRSAFLAAAPQVDWGAYERRLVGELGLVPNPATTQVEDHDAWARWFNDVRATNTVVLDLAQDAWLYVSFGFFVQRARAGEVGSSTMPHKVNPINFETAEGNLQLSSALLAFLSDKLPRSRMQRDLSDSTVARNVGVAMAHHTLALEEILVGLGRVRVDRDACLRELEETPELLAEPIQTILRPVLDEDPYALLLERTRGRQASRDDLVALVEGLTVPEEIKARVRALTVPGYTGDATLIADEISRLAEEALSPFGDFQGSSSFEGSRGSRS